jgi:hypothetical protein
MACPHSTRCALHSQLRTSQALSVWQTLFCDSGFDRCVRYRLTAVGAAVPPDLLPDGRTHLPSRLKAAP